MRIDTAAISLDTNALRAATGQGNSRAEPEEQTTGNPTAATDRAVRLNVSQRADIDPLGPQILDRNAAMTLANNLAAQFDQDPFAAFMGQANGVSGEAAARLLD